MANFSSPLADGRGPVVRERSTYMTDSDAQALCLLFADGLGSGVGYARILSMLERQGGDKRVLNRLRTALLEHGDMLGEAFARYGILDTSARKLILVSEQQGELPGTFRQLAKIYGQRHERKKKLLFALVEPMILFILGMIVARGLFSADFTQLAFQDDTWSQVSDIMLRAVIESLIFVVVCLSIAFTSLNLPVDMPMRSLLHRIFLRIPIISTSGNLYAISLFCLYIRQSIASGMTVYKSLELAGEAANAPSIRGNIRRAQDLIEQGSTLSHALYSIKTIPTDVIENIDIGEETGKLEERLEWLAIRYEEFSYESFQRMMAAFLYVARFVIVIFVISSLMFTLLKMELFPS